MTVKIDMWLLQNYTYRFIYRLLYLFIDICTVTNPVQTYGGVRRLKKKMFIDCLCKLRYYSATKMICCQCHECIFYEKFIDY